MTITMTNDDDARWRWWWWCYVEQAQTQHCMQALHQHHHRTAVLPLNKVQLLLNTSPLADVLLITDLISVLNTTARTYNVGKWMWVDELVICYGDDCCLYACLSVCVHVSVYIDVMTRASSVTTSPSSLRAVKLMLWISWDASHIITSQVTLIASYKWTLKNCRHTTHHQFHSKVTVWRYCGVDLRDARQWWRRDGLTLLLHRSPWCPPMMTSWRSDATAASISVMQWWRRVGLTWLPQSQWCWQCLLHSVYDTVVTRLSNVTVK